MKFNLVVSIIQNSVELGFVGNTEYSILKVFELSPNELELYTQPWTWTMDPNLNKTTKFSLSHYVKWMVHLYQYNLNISGGAHIIGVKCRDSTNEPWVDNQTISCAYYMDIHNRATCPFVPYSFAYIQCIEIEDMRIHDQTSTVKIIIKGEGWRMEDNNIDAIFTFLRFELLWWVRYIFLTSPSLIFN